MKKRRVRLFMSISIQTGSPEEYELMAGGLTRLWTRPPLRWTEVNEEKAMKSRRRREILGHTLADNGLPLNRVREVNSEVNRKQSKPISFPGLAMFEMGCASAL